MRMPVLYQCRLWAMFGIAVVFLAMACPAYSSEAGVSASVEIVSPVSVICCNTVGLSFGRIHPRDGGMMVIAPDDHHAGHGIEMVADSAYTAAHFRVVGKPGNVFSITLPSSVTITSASSAMLVDHFLSNLAGAGRLDDSGMAEVKVGATLHVQKDQSFGHYTGMFEVIVAYN